MVLFQAGVKAQQLGGAIRSLQDEGLRTEAELAPSHLTDVLPVDHMLDPNHVDLQTYVDSLSIEEKPVDFKELGDYVHSRRVIAMKKAGIVLDPIDDASMAPQFDDLVRMLRSDQVESQFDGLVDAGFDASVIARSVSPAFLKENKHTLIKLGVNKSLVNKLVFRDNVTNIINKART